VSSSEYTASADGLSTLRLLDDPHSRNGKLGTILSGIDLEAIRRRSGTPAARDHAGLSALAHARSGARRNSAGRSGRPAPRQASAIPGRPLGPYIIRLGELRPDQFQPQWTIISHLPATPKRALSQLSDYWLSRCGLSWALIPVKRFTALRCAGASLVVG
jgi:hypothetical protein